LAASLSLWSSLKLELAKGDGIAQLFVAAHESVLGNKTDLPMQSSHVRYWGNNGSQISVCGSGGGWRERGGCSNVARSRSRLLALLTNQPPGEIVHA
jgi:hypothetical protein